jgi:hypothetical protein
MEPPTSNNSSCTWLNPRVCAITPIQTLQSPDAAASEAITQLSIPEDIYKISYRVPNILAQLPPSAHLDLDLEVEIKVPQEALVVAVLTAANAGDWAAEAVAGQGLKDGGKAPDFSEVQWVGAHKCAATLRVGKEGGQLMLRLLGFGGWRLICFEPVSKMVCFEGIKIPSPQGILIPSVTLSCSTG